jgi:hypothetical protein
MDFSSPTGLASHAKTLSDYLYDYGKRQDQRSVYSRQFFIYLISACWRKLHRRFCSWQGLGFIYHLERSFIVFKGHLDQIGKRGGLPLYIVDGAVGPGDRTLIECLHLNTEIFDILHSVLPPDFPEEFKLSEPVFGKLSKAVVKAYSGDFAGFYTKDTAHDFHVFVYCAFLLAGQALRMIHDSFPPLAKRGIEKKPEYEKLVNDYKLSISAATMPMKLLQCLLSSSVFQRHIKIWTDNGESLGKILPKWQDKVDNLKFGKLRRILSDLKSGPSSQSATEGGDSVEIDDASKESPTEDDDEDEDDDNALEVCKFICFC